jgi:hypothetical protein
MPNWCNNTLELAHEDPAMLERARDALNRGEFLQEFIPVPEELKIVAGRVGDDKIQNRSSLRLLRNAIVSSLAMLLGMTSA